MHEFFGLRVNRYVLRQEYEIIIAVNSLVPQLTFDLNMLWDVTVTTGISIGIWNDMKGNNYERLEIVLSEIIIRN